MNPPPTRSTRALLRAPRIEPAPCPGSGVDVEAVNPGATRYQEVRCGHCARSFTARVICSRRGVTLPAPVIVVPRHRQESS